MLHPRNSLSGSPRKPDPQGRRGRTRLRLELLEDRTLPSTVNQAFVGQVYQDLLGRPADPTGLAEWTVALDEGESRAAVVTGIITAPSLEFYAQQIQQAYQVVLHRPADPSGMNANLPALVKGETYEQLLVSLAASNEFFSTQGGGTDAGFLNALYENLLGRPIDPTGQAVGSQALAAGASRAKVAAGVVGSLEFQQDLLTSYYQQFLGRAPTRPG